MKFTKSKLSKAKAKRYFIGEVGIGLLMILASVAFRSIHHYTAAGFLDLTGFFLIGWGAYYAIYLIPNKGK